MQIVKIEDEFIRLGQALKLAGLADTGVEAKEAITEGCVKVNGETELQRGKKLRDGDIVEWNDKSFRVESCL